MTRWLVAVVDVLRIGANAVGFVVVVVIVVVGETVVAVVVVVFVAVVVFAAVFVAVVSFVVVVDPALIGVVFVVGVFDGSVADDLAAIGVVGAFVGFVILVGTVDVLFLQCPKGVARNLDLYSLL